MAQGSSALALPHPATLASFTLQLSSWLASSCYTCIIYITAQLLACLRLQTLASFTLQPSSWLASSCYTCIIYITAQLLACLILPHLHHLHYSPALGLPHPATLASFTLQPSSWLASGCYTCIIYITTPPPPPQLIYISDESTQCTQHSVKTQQTHTNQPSQKKQKHTQVQPCSHQRSDSHGTREETELGMGVCVCVGEGGGV